MRGHYSTGTPYQLLQEPPPSRSLGDRSIQALFHQLVPIASVQRRAKIFSMKSARLLWGVQTYATLITI
ncbi:hypothetical protein LMH87_004550 [Akanthomyces muscarius]|uniref:Uncharacterized protein n=1 Tax=Akanthomyces muscarius TaxID=2231603 RepID=A0A9W8Q5V8_AKAMU|nr:hypothetical protein LMH87_004550 [Akanthomyces muscarius]KAJ4145712.1 hypothetical protein LMH87_004550 [Akanthomyces muscarius]